MFRKELHQKNWVQKNLSPNKLWVKKKLGPRKVLRQNNRGKKKICSMNDFVQRNFVIENNLMLKNLNLKTCRDQYCFGSKKVLGPKNWDQMNFRTKNVGTKKIKRNLNPRNCWCRNFCLITF